MLPTPLVADLPHDSGDAVEIVIVTYNSDDGSNDASRGVTAQYYGVIRVLNGQTCEQLETIHDPTAPMIGAATPAIADLDGDGIPEIVSHRAESAGGGLVAFKWDSSGIQVGKNTRPSGRPIQAWPGECRDGTASLFMI